MPVFIDPVIGLSIDFALATLLMTGAVLKLLQRDTFAQALVGYRLVPASAIRLATWLIPVSEICLGTCLVVPGVRNGAALFAAVLLLAYGAAMAITLVQGTPVGDCGCSPGGTKQRVSWVLVVRNCVLAEMAAGSAIAEPARSFTMFECANILFAATLLVIVYSTSNLLIATQQNSRELFHD